MGFQFPFDTKQTSLQQVRLTSPSTSSMSNFRPERNAALLEKVESLDAKVNYSLQGKVHVDYTFQVKVIIWGELIFKGNSYKKVKFFYTKARAVSVYGKAFPQISTTSVRIEDQVLPATLKYPFFCNVATSNINQVHVLSHKILNTLLAGKKNPSRECSVQH